MRMTIPNVSSFIFLLLATFFASADSNLVDKIPQDKPEYTKEKKTPPHPLQLPRILIYKDSSCDNDWNSVQEELKKHKVDYHNINLEWNRKQRLILERKAGKKDTSYVFIGNQYIGNHDDLMSIIKQGKLFRLLQE